MPEPTVSGMSFFPASLTGVLKTGAFAWSGALSYYFPYFCWLCWFTVASIYMIKEVNRRARVHEGQVPGVSLHGAARA